MFLGAHQVVAVDGPAQATLGVDDKHGGDAVRLHQLGGLDGERVRRDAARSRMHDLARAQGPQVHAALNQAAQVAIGEDAQHAAVTVHDSRRTQSLGAHFAHELGEPGVGAHARHGLAAAHDVAHMGEQAPPERAARVRAREVLGLEAAGIQQRHRQGISQRQLGRGAGGGR
jgi:hypothetical protein